MIGFHATTAKGKSLENKKRRNKNESNRLNPTNSKSNLYSRGIVIMSELEDDNYEELYNSLIVGGRDDYISYNEVYVNEIEQWSTEQCTGIN